MIIQWWKNVFEACGLAKTCVPRPSLWSILMSEVEQGSQGPLTCLLHDQPLFLCDFHQSPAMNSVLEERKPRGRCRGESHGLLKVTT